MIIAVIKEGKNPPDKRVPLTPAQVKQVSGICDIVVESSDIRAFKDEEYRSKGVNVVHDISNADIMIGVKEVPIEQLIPNKTYLFFSHTIKEQDYNRNLLRAILQKNIRLIDWECLTTPQGARVIGFGRYAGVVGAYNGIRAYGLRTKKFELKPAHLCHDRAELESQLENVDWADERILLTGDGRVARGAIEILEKVGLEKINGSAWQSNSEKGGVYCQITFSDYFTREGQDHFDKADFFQNPSEYVSRLPEYLASADILIAGHYWDSESPFLFTREDVRSEQFNPIVVADISCDIDGPIATTIRPSTIEDPIYGYDPQNEEEVRFDQKDAVTVMAVDNLPCELPRDASEDFGAEFIKHVLPAFFNGDKDEILRRATIAEGGKLTPRYSYLQAFVDGITTAASDEK